MLFRIDHADARPIYQQIVDEVRRALVVGAVAPEDPLPSTRQLAADLKINPNTVQQAYKEMERQGLVYVRRGQGTFVAPLPDETGVERTTMAESVARRALTEAYRHGLSPEELVEAVWKVAEATEGERV